MTGGTGFIGSHLIERLLIEVHNVKVLLRRGVLREQRKGVNIHYGDLLDKSSLGEAVKEVDAVFHLAGALGGSILSTDVFFDVNAKGTENILKACEDSGIRRFIHCSSVGVLGDIDGPPAKEDYPCNPSDPYEESKLEGEKIALSFAKKGMPIVVVRPTWVYGPGDRRTLKLFRAIQRKRFFMVGDGKTFEHPVYISDLIDGMALLLEREIRAGEIFHIGGEEIVTIEELCNLIAAGLGVKIPGFRLPVGPVKLAGGLIEGIYKVFGREAPISPGKIGFFLKNRAYDISKAKRILGYFPKVRLKEGLPVTIRWYRDHGFLN